MPPGLMQRSCAGHILNSWVSSSEGEGYVTGPKIVRVFDLNSPSRIKNSNFNAGLKNMTKLMRIETGVMAIVGNDGL